VNHFIPELIADACYYDVSVSLTGFSTSIDERWGDQPIFQFCGEFIRQSSPQRGRQPVHAPRQCGVAMRDIDR
jgi:hypothetical protein